METFLFNLIIAWIIWFFIIKTIYAFLMTKKKKKKYRYYYDILDPPKGCNPFQEIYILMYREEIKKDYRENILEDELKKYYDIEKVNELFEKYGIKKENEKIDRLFHLLLYHQDYKKLVGWPYFPVDSYIRKPSKKRIEELKNEELFQELKKTKREKKNEN